MSSHSWNAYRYVGDWLHDIAIIVLVVHIGIARSVNGLSKTSQFLYLTLFVSRYLDLLFISQHFYLVVHKLFFISASLAACCAFRVWPDSYEHGKDTVAYLLIFLPCLVYACMYAEEGGVVDNLWTLSQYLEGFAMVPQYIFTYRDGSWVYGRRGVVCYVVLMGAYRSCYALNWVYKWRHLPNYADTHSWHGGVVNLSFFLDFLLFHCTGMSCLRRVTLGADDGINRVGKELQQTLGACLLGGENGDVPEITLGEVRALGQNTPHIVGLQFEESNPDTSHPEPLEGEGCYLHADVSREGGGALE